MDGFKKNSEEEDAGEMTIYLIVKDMQVGELTGTYYQTYGGGPEGGIYKTREGWYEIDRGWYKPWKLTKLESHVIHFNHEYEMGEQDTPSTIRVTYIPQIIFDTNIWTGTSPSRVTIGLA